MGYVEQNLVTGEAVVYRGSLHWIVLLRPALIALLLAAPGIAMLYESTSTDQTYNKEALIGAGVFMVLIGATVFGTGMVRRKAAEFAVTNKRVILKRGLLRRKTEEIFLQKIESVGVDQDLMGRMLNYGTISVRGVGGTLEPFSHVSHALEFRRQVQEQIAKAP